MAAPFEPEIVSLPWIREAVTLPKRLRICAAPWTSATDTLPLAPLTSTDPTLPVRSIAPKEFSMRCSPLPLRNTILPLAFERSPLALRFSTEMSPNLLRAARGIVSGIAMSKSTE